MDSTTHGATIKVKNSITLYMYKYICGDGITRISNLRCLRTGYSDTRPTPNNSTYFLYIQQMFNVKYVLVTTWKTSLNCLFLLAVERDSQITQGVYRASFNIYPDTSLVHLIHWH